MKSLPLPSTRMQSLIVLTTFCCLEISQTSLCENELISGYARSSLLLVGVVPLPREGPLFSCGVGVLIAVASPVLEAGS